jgi:Ran GTPase-activating protein (RanGAP) involved in mRNA processing and transport
VVPLLDRLSSKSPLEEFDISNNKIGDPGAVALSEMLRDNTALKVLKCDNNAITLTGTYQLTNKLLNIN